MPDPMAQPCPTTPSDPAALPERTVPPAAPLLVDPADLTPPGGALVVEHREHWGEVYDWTYATPGADPALDTAGWRAAGSGEALPAEQMAEWADRTVELVLATRPRRVLELGCGTGLLLHRLHPHLDAYVGTDIAAEVVERHTRLGLPGVTVVRAAAHEARGAAVSAALGGAAPDCVLLNSVTQCFPDVAYLTAVLRDAVGLVAPGGTVVVGDVRHAGLHRRHCAELDPHDPDARAAADPELLLDPATIATAALAAGRDVRIAVHAKALTADTELARYRFDAVLHVDAPTPEAEPHRRHWTDLGPTPLTTLTTLTTPTRVDGIPHALLTSPTHPALRSQNAVVGPAGERSGSDVRWGVTAAEVRGVRADAAVLVDVDDPTALVVVVPAALAPVPAVSLAGPGWAHEPLPAFARRRTTEVARRSARRTGAPAPGPVLLPAGRFATDPGPARTAGLAALAPDARAVAEGGDTLPAAVRALDAAGRHAIADALEHLGPDADRRVADRHRWILRRWRAVHAEHGRPAGGPPPVEPACAALGYPPAMARFFRAAAAEMPRLIADEVALQALLFPDGEILTALGTYQDNTVNRYLNGALAHLAAEAAATRRGPLRVLELGAGVGGSTAAVLDALGGRAVDHLFTDVSPFFTTAARERFGDHPALRYGLLDVDTDLATHPERHDLVVAANVLHNAVDVRATLRSARDVLAPGGVLALVESTREHVQVLTSMHLLMSPRPGRAPAGSGDRRAGTDRIFLDEREWWAELAAAGLVPVLGLPGPGPLDALGQRLFVAVRP